MRKSSDGDRHLPSRWSGLVDIDIKQVRGCICLSMRRVTRRITQIYDHALAPAGITANQFGLLTHLYGANLGGSPGLSIGTLAVRLGTDPTTLNRTLKPLQEKGLVSVASDAEDGRVRLTRITDRGQAEIRTAMPLWRSAQTQVETALGATATSALTKLLDLAAAALAEPVLPADRPA
jgi:DNA-binding MarR family transcriptional regulator